MDFDYYIVTTLIVKCQKNNMIEIHSIEFERYKMYYLFLFGYKYDNNYSNLAKKEIEYVSEIYSGMDHVIYENKDWKIDVTILITEYTNYMTINGIDLNDVIKIEKKHYYQSKN